MTPMELVDWPKWVFTCAPILGFNMHSWPLVWVKCTPIVMCKWSKLNMRPFYNCQVSNLFEFYSKYILTLFMSFQKQFAYSWLSIMEALLSLPTLLKFDHSRNYYKMAKNWWKNWTTCTLGDAKIKNLTWNYKFNFLPNPSGPYYMGKWTTNASFMYN